MRRITSLFLMFVLCLCACAGPVETPEPADTPELASTPEPVQTAELSGGQAGGTAVQVAQAVLESQGYDDLSPLSGEDLDFYLNQIYGLEEVSCTDAAVYTASGVDAREIAVIRLAYMTYDGTTSIAALEEYRQNRLADFFGYAPEQAALLENARVVSGWSCVALLVCEDMEAAQAAFEDAAGEAAAYAPVDEQPAEGMLSTAETRWFIPFDPPNEYDMSLYDTSAIQAAYASGDESGLSEKDAAILKKCREVLSECITPDMTDFEKELALHDWLVENCAYDESVHNFWSPQGRSDNNNPYGPLMEGYGICLGYATTFQLLMDLAEVECITVVGASTENREDHAWNMVKLEGEWYCVDPTWDDPVGLDGHPDISSPTDKQHIRTHHRYFNVTSAFMRMSDHQWDYLNVPETAASRFFWNGAGELPT